MLLKIWFCTAPAWWRSGQGVGLATAKVAGSTPGLVLSGNNLGQVVHTHVPPSPSSIIWYRSRGAGAVMPCRWEGNRRSGVALAMRHRLQWFIYLRAQGLRKADERLMGCGTLPYLTARVGFVAAWATFR